MINSTNKQKSKLPIITERFLVVVLKVLCSKTDLSQRELSNINKLLDIIDKKYYENFDVNLGALLKSIEIITNFKLKNKEIDENNSESYLIEIQSELSAPYYKEPLENMIIPLITASKNKKYSYDATFINEEIYTYLMYNKVIIHREEVSTSVNNITSSSGRELREELEQFRNMLNHFVDYYREIDIANYENDLIYSSEPRFFDEMKTSFEKSKNPSYVLKTGLQYMNMAMSDRNGILPGLNLFYANINSFKSGLLKHFCRWIYLYNVDVFRRIKKKTGKKPVIFYGSFENTKQEDMERDVKMYTHRDLYTFKDFNELETEWKKSVEEMSGVSFEELNDLVEIVYYNPANPIKVSDLKNLFYRLQDQNYVIVAAILDYLEQFKMELEDSKRNSEFYLGKVASDLYDLSKLFDCAIISAHQLNRAGASVLYDNKDSGKQNAVNSLNTTFIGKDWDINKKATFAGFIDLETDQATGKTYLTYKKAKQRGKQTISNFVHEIKDGIIIEDDIRLSKPTSQLAITPPNSENLAFSLSNESKNNGSRGRTTTTPQEIIIDPKRQVNVKKGNLLTLKNIASTILEATKDLINESYIYKSNQNRIYYNEQIIKNNDQYIKSPNKITVKDVA